ncbi:GNAT family N-acetyltransferase [Bacteroides sp. 214]|uniref:GNAT family N-acetyltransferase n=1 Tax=Bacteroides sp. 214 TaxID=2302935 RepID=UPI0013D3082D|nr:GNAT family N-acetyltransferase [Bacteroides sp. 214]NDW12002.1 GNAT family N-acetyltransferase [Bacteroides sp. 214]
MGISNKKHSNEYNIIHLPKEQWQNQIIPTECQTESRLYKESCSQTCAWGVLIDEKLVAAIEAVPETTNRGLRINVLWVDVKYRKQGIGHSLIEVAKEWAKIERKQIIIAVPPSTTTIEFLKNEGFTSENFGNADLALEFGWKSPRKAWLTRSEVEIREERLEDYHEVERMLQKTFWNKFQKGADEHYLVHLLRNSAEYLPKLSRILLKDGEIIGAIFYSLAYVQDGDKQHDVLTFGPLGVSVDWRGCGVGELLLQETMQMATDAGYCGIIILGVPDYYPRLGFQTCDKFGITTEDGKNFDAFMGMELIPNGMKDIHGKFYQSPFLANLPQEETEEYNKLFPPLEKQYFPFQW